MRITLIRSFLIGLILLPAAMAQGTGTIHGNATDPTGLAVPNATVTALLVERGTARTVTTNERGEFVFPLLAVGTYTVTVAADGFRKYQREGVELTANENVRVDAQLIVGAAAESVTVTAEAPLVDSRSSVVGTLIDSRRVLELPTNGRNVVSLANLLPGVTQVTAPQTFTGDRDGPTVSISGSRPTQNSFLFDGGHFNAHFRNSGLAYPPPDALQEVKVLMNSFSAEYGRNAGAIFNVVTRSGTNDLHGSAWEFLRNHNLNARNFFAPSAKPRLIQNQFGGALGGPVKKNKLFLFGSYEGLRVRPATLLTSTFPLTPAERAGDFSSVSAAVRDPLTGLAFPGNRIPASRLDPVASQVLSKELMPLPNRPDGQYVATYPTSQDNDNLLVRTDYSAGAHTLEGRYYLNDSAAASYAGQVPSYMPQARGGRTQAVNIGDTWVVRPTLINQLRLSFSRYRNGITVLSDTHLTDLGGNMPIIGPKVPPALLVTGRINLGDGAGLGSLDVNESINLSESVHWTRSSHTVKAGFEFLRLKYLNRSYWQSSGVFTFNGQITGNGAADFVLGRPATLVVASPELEQSGLQTSTYYYIQDDWRVHPRLTLNLGLRWELALPWVQPDDLWSTFRPGEKSQLIPTAPTGILFPRDPGVPRGMIATDKNNLAPRFGFAWDIGGDGRTSLRGAYGIFYESPNADLIQNVGQPWRYTFTIPTPFSLTDPLRGQPAIPLGINRNDPVFTGIQDLAYPDPNFRTAYVQNYNLNIQRQVSKDLSVQVGYVGRLARKLIMGLAANPAVYGPGATPANLNSRRIHQGFGELRVISSLGNSHYNGLQVEVTKRYSRGFSLQGAYTFSRAIDMKSLVAAVGSQTPNVWDLSTEYGLSDFHAKQVASLSWIWDLPAVSSGPAPVRWLAQGWQVNGLVTYRSGLPLNVLSGRDNALTGTPNQRPDVVGDPHLPSGRPKQEKILSWFNRAAFAHPATGQFGNVGRNALIGPSQAAANLGVFKSFPIPVMEGMRLQFRSEFFNVLNNVNLGNPNMNLTANQNMGRITSAGGARVIQFALKLLF